MRFFPPVVKHTYIRMLLAIVAQFDLELEQMDIKTTFLHNEMEEKILLAQRPLAPSFDDNKPYVVRY